MVEAYSEMDISILQQVVGIFPSFCLLIRFFPPMIVGQVGPSSSCFPSLVGIYINKSSLSPLDGLTLFHFSNLLFGGFDPFLDIISEGNHANGLPDP